MSFENSSDHISLESSSMKMALPRMTSGGLFLPRTIFFSLLIALALVCAGVAQDTDETETGSVTGTVTSTKGAPIAGVRILLTDRLTGKTSAVRTNAQGKYNSGDIAAADYT